MPEILISVANKIPQLAGDVRQITSGNRDYRLRLIFDDDWEDGEKTVLFVRENGFVYPPVRTENDECVIPEVNGVPIREWLYIGVKQGEVHTSRPCGVTVYRSINDMIDDEAVQPDPSMWEDVLERLEELEANGGGTGGGTSIDVTAQVGQTIVVKEVDKNGKPTKWESVGYQPPIGYDPAKKTLFVTTWHEGDTPGVVVSHSYDEIAEHVNNGGAVMLDDVDAGKLALAYMYASTAYFSRIVTTEDSGAMVVQAAVKGKSITYNTTNLPVSQTDLVGNAMISLAGASYDALEMQAITFPPGVTGEADQMRMLRAGAVKAIVTVFEGDGIAEAGVLDCIEGDGLTWVFAGVMIGKKRTAFVTVQSIGDSNEYEANVLAVHEGGGSSGDAMRLKVLAELPYEGTPPIIDMIDFTRKYTFADIAEAYVAGRTITLNTEYDLVPYQYGVFRLEKFTQSGGGGRLEFHGHYWRVPDVEADVDEGWVPAVAFLREDGTLTVEDREWSGYAQQAEVDKLSKAIEDKLDADKLPAAINTALAQAKESGEFDGEDGSDYVLTEADKTEIAQEAAALVDTALLSIIGTGEVTA